ncbi:MAG TPA: hypothetical protein VK046_14930, partial [Actinomycetaceae bacterium]|nr:hypothetical protein [Actinomycetaceae bacterium]
GVHLVGGLVGTVLIGFLATEGGLLYGGGLSLLLVQVIIALVAIGFSAVVTLVIAVALKATLGWRVTGEVEASGIDAAVHGESPYDGLGGGIAATVPPREPVRQAATAEQVTS